jgi:predicted deacylase
MQQAFRIGADEVAPGQHKSIYLPLPDFYTHNSASMPVHVIHGRQPGPCVVITSSIHGDEINGVEIIRRLLSHKSLTRLKGTLILVSVVNVYGFLAQSRYLPDRRDLNRSFPGLEKGSLAARLAYLLLHEVVSKGNYIIDLHTGAINRENLPQIRATVNGDPAMEALARAFGAPVIIDTGLTDGTLRKSAHALGIPSLVYEAGEALRFDEVSIRAGVDGILRFLGHLEMIRKRPKKNKHTVLVAKSSQWIRAPKSGIERSVVALGTQVEKGDILAYISNPFGEEEETVISTAAGIVIGRTKLPLVHEGEALFHIARFAETAEAAESIESFQDAFDPGTDLVESEEPPLIG